MKTFSLLPLRHRQTACLIACTCLLCLGTLSGCQSAQVGESLTAKLAGNQPDQQLEFWHTLADRPLVSHDEAFHALLLFADQNDPAQDYAQRVNLLKERHWLAEDFDAPADHAITRGTLSVALVQILQMRGGWVMMLIGPTPRYATRELEFQGIYPPSTPQQTFSGSQFLAIIGAVEDYQRGNQVNLSAKLLPNDVPPESPGSNFPSPASPGGGGGKEGAAPETPAPGVSP